MLTYDSSTKPVSPHATDPLWLFSRQEWPALPFRPQDVEKARVGEVLQLTGP